MTFYSVVLLVHSWTRWLVVVAALVALVTMAVGGLGKRPFGGGETKAVKLYVRAFEVQVLLGLLLYFVLSPLGVSLFGQGGVMKEPVLRYFAVEHIFGMLLAIAAAEIFWGRARRAPDDRRRGPAFAAVLVPLLIVLGTMPWPGRAYARPLFRTPSAALVAPAAPSLPV